MTYGFGTSYQKDSIIASLDIDVVAYNPQFEQIFKKAFTDQTLVFLS
jgi:hypothetical protein